MSTHGYGPTLRATASPSIVARRGKTSNGAHFWTPLSRTGLVLLGNRLGQLLANAWPEFEEHFGDLRSDYVRLVLHTWPLPSDFGRARSAVVRRLFTGVTSRLVQPAKIEEARSVV